MSWGSIKFHATPGPIVLVLATAWVRLAHFAALAMCRLRGHRPETWQAVMKYTVSHGSAWSHGVACVRCGRFFEASGGAQ